MSSSFLPVWFQPCNPGVSPVTPAGPQVCLRAAAQAYTARSAVQHCVNRLHTDCEYFQKQTKRLKPTNKQKLKKHNGSCSYRLPPEAAPSSLDPSVQLILQTPDMVPLRRAAQSFMQNLAAQYNPATTSQDTVIATQTAAESPPTVLQKYRFLASRMEVNVSMTVD